MTRPLRLIVFDVDGTLVDSQGDILASMGAAFAAAERPAPDRATILSIVGLSLPVAMATLAPDLGPDTQARMVETYKDSYASLRRAGGAASSPLYPGALEVLDQLSAVPENLIGLATGKSRRGLDALLESHGLTGRFVTEQVADHHPSKPHPAMLHAALAETGVYPGAAVMIGDTGFDMEMARAAGIAAIGVSWSYHPRARLAAADLVIDRFDALPAAIDTVLETTA